MLYLESGGEGVFWKEGGGGASNLAAGSRRFATHRQCHVKRNQYYGLKANFDQVICTEDQDCKGLYGKKNCWSTRRCSAATFYIDP